MSENPRAELPELIALGRIVRAQGLNGAVRVLPYGITPEVAANLGGKAIHLQLPARKQTLTTTLTHQRWQRSVWIVEFANCTTRNDAEALVGWEVHIAEEDRPPLHPDEFYSDQLIGLGVENLQSGKLLGNVIEIIPSVSADLLEVARFDGKRFLLPLQRVFVKEVNLSSRLIRVDLPDGLTEITY